MPNLRLTLAYDGTRFAGWAAQPGQRTVESELARAIEQIGSGRRPIRVAGRTDAGVHARAQVASLPWDSAPEPWLRRSLNATTPRDLAVVEVAAATDGFDARRDALSRTYCYRLQTGPVRDPFERGRALFWPHGLDREALDECAQALAGEHDFTAFTPSQTHHVRFRRRILNAYWRDAEPGISELWIEADSFMRSMVRIIAGTLLEVGSGRRSVEEFRGLLDGVPRPEAGETAPAHGLYLESVRYSDWHSGHQPDREPSGAN